MASLTAAPRACHCDSGASCRIRRAGNLSQQLDRKINEDEVLSEMSGRLCASPCARASTLRARAVVYASPCARASTLRARAVVYASFVAVDGRAAPAANIYCRQEASGTAPARQPARGALHNQGGAAGASQRRWQPQGSGVRVAHTRAGGDAQMPGGPRPEARKSVRSTARRPSHAPRHGTRLALLLQREGRPSLAPRAGGWARTGPVGSLTNSECGTEFVMPPEYGPQDSGR